MAVVEFNSNNVNQFYKAYNKARTGQKEVFTFEGAEYVTNYAYYLLQHLMNEHLISGSFDENKLFIKGNPKHN